MEQRGVLAAGGAAALAFAVLGAGAMPARAARAPAVAGPAQIPVAAGPAAVAPPTMARVAPDQPVTIYLSLQRPEGAAQALVRAVSDPSSTQYRQFPSKQVIRSKYGASAQTVRRVTQAASRRGLTVTVDPTGVFATVTGPARRMGAWLKAPFSRSKLPIQHAGTGFLVAALAARVPKELRGAVLGLVPASTTVDYDELQLSGVVTEGYVTGQKQTTTNKGTPQGCLPEQYPILSARAYSYNQLRAAYGVDALPSGADVGGATRMAIMAQGSGFDQQDLDISRECFGLPGVQFQRQASAGTESQLPVGDEGSLDVQIVQSVLPQGSQVTVVEANRYGNSFLSWSTVFGLATQPDVISSSYGQCEPSFNTAASAAGEQLTESVLLRVGLSGTSVFSAAGDDGSSDCMQEGMQPTEALKRPSVDYPGSSPYVTSVGGSRITLNEQNARAGEVVWNDSELPKGEAQPASQAGAGGGGFSQLFSQPWWQAGAGTGSNRRTVPDLSAHASNFPAWPLVWGGSLQSVGGTSAATPMVASAVAIIAAQERLAGRPPLGPVQPWLYRLRREQPDAFFDIVHGSNDLYDQGCCTARTGYDPASGLGAPNFAVIAGQVPAPGRAS